VVGSFRLMPNGIPELQQECFFITPIGAEGSPERARADAVLRAIVEPVAQSVNLVPIRADRIEEGGHITLQVIEHVCRAKLAIADLTGRNLNVYYEVGMRHTARAPMILIADASEQKNIPFDLLQQRTIFFTDDMAGTAACVETARQQAERAMVGHLDSPVDAAINLRSLQQGSPVEQVVAELVDRVEGLAEAVSKPRRVVRPATIPKSAMVAFSKHLAELLAISEERNDQELMKYAIDLLSLLIAYSPERPPQGVPGEKMNVWVREQIEGTGVWEEFKDARRGRATSLTPRVEPPEASDEESPEDSDEESPAGPATPA
jgi:hypothetical protein